MSDELLRERQGHIEILTINRPEARNAINLRHRHGAVAAALDEIEADDDVWVVVLTAAGDKAFSAGMDLKAFAAGEFRHHREGVRRHHQAGLPEGAHRRRATARHWPAAARSC